MVSEVPDVTSETSPDVTFDTSNVGYQRLLPENNLTFLTAK